MKLNNSKKPKKKFDPIKHWYMILITFFILAAFVVLYSIYSFFYIKKQIVHIEEGAKNNIQNSTSTEAVEKTIDSKNFLNNINTLNKTLEYYEKRELEYNRLLKTAVPAPTIATTTSSTTVATSTE